MTFEILTDIRQTAQYAKFMQTLGWQVIHYNRFLLYIRKLPLLPLYVGKLLRAHRPLSDEEVSFLKSQYRLINFSWEPFDIERCINGRVYLRVNKWSLQLTPTKTLWLDLTKPQTTLFKQLKPKLRYNIKMAGKKLKTETIPGIKLTTGRIGEIVKMWSFNKPYSRLFPAPEKEFVSMVTCFKDNCFVIRCYTESEPDVTLAFCLVLCSPDMAFYWHNSSSLLGKKLFGPSLCVWQAIGESQKRSLQIFDFEGLFDERFPNRNTGWKGFSTFKEGFVTYS